ncbi:mobilization protein [Salmonella enterica subsp. enterica]|nr:mobilization protein [Salmonella enterica subsp. enterica serovar Mikawasima]EDV1111804.1 mobilization protein [Salmonella enterica subsp. enterica serovar Mikawasima]EED9407520.1 mobilization protein [Salmonella enterica subsp. enterica serovar Mikawasima]
MAVKNKRSGSNIRQKTKVLSVRLSHHEYELIRSLADDSNLSFSGYMREKALHFKIIKRIPERYLTELIELGKEQRKLFDSGLRTTDAEYLDVMHRIIKFSEELKELIEKKSLYLTEILRIESELEILARTREANLYGRHKRVRQFFQSDTEK